MRWPFSIFSRGSPAAPADPGDAAAVPPPTADGDVAGPGDGAGGTAPREAAGPAAWRALPPVQRAAGAAPLTAPALPFARGLAGRNGPEPTIAPLAHDVAADGSIGLVGGLATPPVQRAVSSPAADAGHASPGGLPFASLHRAGTARRPGVSVASLPPVQPWTSEPAGGTEAGPVAVDETPPLPLRTLPAVAAPQVALDATHVAAASAPEPVHSLAVVARASGEEAAAAGSSEAMADAAPPAAAPGAGSGDASDAILPAGEATPSASAVIGRRSLGASRRLGLGAPLPSRPVQRASDVGPDLPLAAMGRGSRGASGTSSAVPPAMPAAGATAPLPVLRAVGVERAAPSAAGVPAPAGGESDASDAPVALDGRPARPLASDAARRPLDPASASSTMTPGSPDADAVGLGHLPLAGMPAVQRSVAVPPEATAAAEQAAAAPGPETPTGADPVGALGTVNAETSVGAAGPTAITAAPDDATLKVAHPLAGMRPSVQRTGAMPLTVGASPGHAPVATQALVAAGQGGKATAGASGAGGLASGRAAPGPGGRLAPGGTPTVGPSWIAGPATRDPGGFAAAPLAAVGAPAFGGATTASPSLLPVVSRRALDGGSGTSSAARTSVAVLPATPDSHAFDGSAGGQGGAAGLERAAPADAGPFPVLQRAVEINEITTSVTPSTSGGARVSGGAAGDSGDDGGTQDMDALADRLYPKVRDRLALDLLLERERAGLLGDL